MTSKALPGQIEHVSLLNKSTDLKCFACPFVFIYDGFCFDFLQDTMSSVMLRRFSSHLLTYSRVSCPIFGSASCALRFPSPDHKWQNFLVPSTTQLTTVFKCSNSQPYTMIYRLPHIKLLRAVSRLKLLQTSITVVILPPVYYFYLQGDVSLFLVGYSTGVALFAGVMLYAASHFFRRVVGMMYLDPAQTTLKVSHLTFWGKRSDFFVPVSDVMTIADTGDSTRETILKLKRYSSPETFYFSMYYGRILDKQGFEKVFGSLSI